VVVSAAGDAAAAQKLFERSYTAYERAVQLEPDSVRLRNDLLLMLLYHLKRDMDRVPGVLQASIADGERQLAEDPPTDEAELRNLQEAVGDCFENLGLYYMEFAVDKAKAKANFEKSLTFYPFRQRRAVALIRQLDGWLPQGER
jgi:hypothetical protein